MPENDGVEIESKLKILTVIIFVSLSLSLILTAMASFSADILGFMSKYTWSYETESFSIYIPWLALSLLATVIIISSAVHLHLKKNVYEG